MEGSEQEYTAPYGHDKLRRMVENYLAITKSNARKAQEDRDFFDGKQLTADELHTLAQRGQPPIVTNKLYSAISGLLGILDAGVSDPECFPRTVSSQDAADVATKTLRYIAHKTNYKKVRQETSSNFLIEGHCAGITEVVGQDVKLSRIRWEDFIFDPYSTAYDFSDAKFMGVAKLLDLSDVRQMFPESDIAIEGNWGDFNDDRAKNVWWADKERRQCRIVDIYYEAGGTWHRAVFSQSGMLWAGPSEHQDDAGNSRCPIEAERFEIDRSGDSYGAIRQMKDPQREINARRSRLLQLANMRQTRQTDMMAQATDKTIAKREAAKADGTIPFGYDVVQTQDMAQGQMLILNQSMADLDRMAPTPAVLGRLTSSAESGRARQILQQAGYTELARTFGRFEDFELRLYRSLWLAARQFLTDPMLVRIADDPRAVAFLSVNEPVQGPVQVPAIHPATGQPLFDPTTGMPLTIVRQGTVGVRNQLAKLDMDILISTVPETANLEQEVFEKIMETMGSLGIAPGDPRLIPMLELIPLPDKRATIGRYKRAMAEAQQENAPAQQAAQQQASEQHQVEIQLKGSKAQKDQASAAKNAAEATRTNLENEFMQHSWMNAAYGHHFPNAPGANV